MMCEKNFIRNIRFLLSNQSWEVEKMEEPGFEPGAFRMRSGHSTTELHPLIELTGIFL